MELYTSLTRLKMSLNNGVLPPMTPLTERAKKFIDPAFTSGMGALNEDVFKGLQCPVRGCGRWFHRLYQHIGYSHRNIGGVRAVRRALDIPAPIRLCSCWQRALGVESIRALQGTGRWHPLRGSSRGSHTGPRRTTQGSTVNLNLRDRCNAQLTHRIADLANKIGRSPSQREFAAEYGFALAQHGVRVYGTWNSLLSQCELPRRTGGQQRTSPDALFAAFEAYYDVHYSLPSFRQAKAPTRTPVIPTPERVYRTLGTTCWPEAMRRVAAALGIVGGRYGLPAQQRAS